MEFSSKLHRKKMVEVLVWRYTGGSERESEKGVCFYEKKKKKCKEHLL